MNRKALSNRILGNNKKILLTTKPKLPIILVMKQEKQLEEQTRVVNVEVGHTAIEACRARLTAIRTATGDPTQASRPAALCWAAGVVARMTSDEIETVLGREIT